MFSRIAQLTIAVLFVPALSCTNVDEVDHGNYQVGRKADFYSASYLWGAGDQNTVVAVAEEGMTLQRFTIEPFAHVTSIPLPFDDKEQNVAASSDGAYYISLTQSEYAILKANGEVIKNPMPLVGNITTLAFDPVHNLAVISDEFQTMALLVMDAAGNIVTDAAGNAQMWKAGSLVADKLVKSGAMLGDGRLILAIGTTTIAIVDVAASVAAQPQRWIFTEFEVADATDMKWISPVPGDTDRIMVMDGDRLLAIQLSTMAVTSQIDLSGKTVLGNFRDFIPHVVVRSATEDTLHEVNYMGANGELKTSPIRGTDRWITQTMLSSDGTLTIVYDPDRTNSSYKSGEDQATYTRASVYRFRLSDNAGLDKAEVDDKVNLALTPDHLFLLYPSALGKAVRRNYGPDPQDQTLEGYNLDIVRGQ